MQLHDKNLVGKYFVHRYKYKQESIVYIERPKFLWTNKS